MRKVKIKLGILLLKNAQLEILNVHFRKNMNGTTFQQSKDDEQNKKSCEVVTFAEHFLMKRGSKKFKSFRVCFPVYCELKRRMIECKLIWMKKYFIQKLRLRLIILERFVIVHFPNETLMLIEFCQLFNLQVQENTETH